jgi:hypothetical protein
MNWKEYGKKQSYTNSSFNYGILLKRVKKTATLSVRIGSTDLRLNTVTPK